MQLLSKFLNRSGSSREIPTIQLLSREGCHLCEDALQVLAADLKHTRIEVLDITREPDLEAIYVFRIPVVLHSGNVIAEGVIGKAEARTVRRHLSDHQRAKRSKT